jgi:hypothetical protein
MSLPTSSSSLPPTKGMPQDRFHFSVLAEPAPSSASFMSANTLTGTPRISASSRPVRFSTSQWSDCVISLVSPRNFLAKSGIGALFGAV